MLGRVADELGTDLVVKPATGGSSLGITFVAGKDELPQAVLGGFSYADTVLIERRITGVEVAVSVLDGRPLPAVEIEAPDVRLRRPLHRRRDHLPRPGPAR